MRTLIALAAATLVASIAPPVSLAEEELSGGVVEARLPAHEPNTYRYGLPLSAAPGTNPGECELVCNQDNACSAWSLVPVAADQAPRCELKRSVGRAQYRPGATSGIAARLQPPAPVATPDETSQTATAPAIKPVPHPAPANRSPVSISAPASTAQPMIFYPTKPDLLGGNSHRGTGQSLESWTPPPAPVPPAAPRPPSALRPASAQ